MWCCCVIAIFCFVFVVSFHFQLATTKNNKREEERVLMPQQWQARGFASLHAMMM